MLTKVERFKQIQELSKLFPEANILKPSKNYIARCRSNQLTPFDLDTGKLTSGDYKGKTLDEIFEIDPAYIFRMSYYLSNHWEPLHQLHFIKWTLELRNKLK